MNVQRKRYLAYLLLVFYILGIVYTIYDTYITLRENYYNTFDISCHNLDSEGHCSLRKHPHWVVTPFLDE